MSFDAERTIGGIFNRRPLRLVEGSKPEIPAAVVKNIGAETLGHMFPKSGIISEEQRQDIRERAPYEGFRFLSMEVGDGQHTYRLVQMDLRSLNGAEDGSNVVELFG